MAFLSHGLRIKLELVGRLALFFFPLAFYLGALLFGLPPVPAGIEFGLYTNTAVEVMSYAVLFVASTPVLFGPVAMAAVYVVGKERLKPEPLRGGSGKHRSQDGHDIYRNPYKNPQVSPRNAV